MFDWVVKMTIKPADSDSLREALLAHCRLAGWTPQHLGQTEQEQGLEEALREIIATREAEATQLSLELIELCEVLGWQSPWLQDNRARSLADQGRDLEARAIWEKLADHTNPAVASTARETISNLQNLPASAALAGRIRQLYERNQPELGDALILDALLNSQGDLPPELASLLEELAARHPTPTDCPWDPELQRHELLLLLYEKQFARLTTTLV